MAGVRASHCAHNNVDALVRGIPLVSPRPPGQTGPHMSSLFMCRSAPSVKLPWGNLRSSVPSSLIARCSYVYLHSGADCSIGCSVHCVCRSSTWWLFLLCYLLLLPVWSEASFGLVLVTACLMLCDPDTFPLFNVLPAKLVKTSANTVGAWGRSRGYWSSQQEH